jgi:Dolichyl-phosphate-mannose-protein mannosyltransferase
VGAAASTAPGAVGGPPGRRFGSPTVWLIAGLYLAFNLATANVYGLFVDELYFLACGEHLAWGYVDMPPLTALQAWFAQSVLGGSQFAIRLLPAIEGAALILLVGALVRALGGGRFAQGLAALATALAPAMLVFYSFLSMNAVEPLVWTGMAYATVRLVASRDPRWWLLFGTIAGIGLENKDTVVVYGFAVVAATLLTGERRLLANRFFFLGGAIAVVLFLPNLLWMIGHHFPHLEMLANIRRSHRNVALSPLAFIAQQGVLTNPVAAPLWLGGLWWLLADRSARRLRLVGIAYLASLIVLLATGGRVYYLAAAYPALFAAGARALEGWRAARLRLAYAVLVVVSGIVFAPLCRPVLPAESYIAYSNALGLHMPRIENRRTSALPQLFADRFGWPEMAQAVARAYRALPPGDRARCAIFGQDYGQAGAIDHFGPALGLPKALSGHLTYWYWGPRGYTGDVVLVMGDRRSRLEELFASVEPVAEVGQKYAMASQHWTLFLCRQPRGWTFPELWPQLKNWD